MALHQLHPPISVLPYCTLQTLSDVDGHRHQLFCYKTNLQQNCCYCSACLTHDCDASSPEQIHYLITTDICTLLCCARAH